MQGFRSVERGTMKNWRDGRDQSRIKLRRCKMPVTVTRLSTTPLYCTASNPKSLCALVEDLEPEPSKLLALLETSLLPVLTVWICAFALLCH